MIYKDGLHKSSIDTFELNSKKQYTWDSEWQRGADVSEQNKNYKKFIDFSAQHVQYTYDPYVENRDQACIGMQSTIITDRFYAMPSDKHILDVGAGNVDLMRYLTNNSNNSVVGLDIGLEGQKRFYADNRQKLGTLLYLDVSNDKFPFIDNVFDVCFFTETIEHLGNPAHALMEIKRVLKEDGELVITFPEAEDQKGYWHGNHAFVYPGLFYRKHFRRFMIQLFFKQIKYFKNGDTGKYVFKNIKKNFINPYAIVKGDWLGNLVYNDVRMINEDMEKEWKDFLAEDMESFNG